MGNLKDRVNLENLAHVRACFAHSGKSPIGDVDKLIKGQRPFYYFWRDELGNGIDILTFKDPNKPETAKLFRYSAKQLYHGVDLDKDKPTFVGRNVIEVLQEHIIRARYG